MEYDKEARRQRYIRMKERLASLPQTEYQIALSAFEREKIAMRAARRRAANPEVRDRDKEYAKKRRARLKQENIDKLAGGYLS